MKTELKGILNQNDHNEEMSNIIKNLSSIYSSISDGLIKVSNYLSKYQLLRENKSKIKNNGENENNMIDLTINEENEKPKEPNKSNAEDKNNLVIVLNNSPKSSNNIINEKEKEEKIKENSENKNEENIKVNENKEINSKDNKEWEINSFLKNLNMNLKSNSKKANRSEMKLPINNINNYYFKEINITNNNNINKCRSELRKKKEENKNKKNSINKKDKIENNNIIDLEEEEENEKNKLQKKDSDLKNNINNLKKEEKKEKKQNSNSNSNKGYKFKIKFLDYCYVFGYYTSYNDAFYDKIQITKYFNEIDLFNLNYNEKYSYKNINISLKEKYPLLSVKYLKNNINYETKIKAK